jgi:hypothetical protein
MRKLIISLVLLVSSISFAQPLKIEGPDPIFRWVQSDKYLGNVVVITVVSRYTEKESYYVNWRLGTRLRDNDNSNLQMITIIDFIGIPRFGLIYDYARKRILKETAGSPVKYICDTTEKLRTQLSADPRHRVDIIVLDKTGEVRGHFAGSKDIDAAIKLIDELTGR